MSRPADERGGTGDRAFMAFKLHRFLSGAGRVHATLRATPQRRVTLDGQLFDPDDPDQKARFYETFFCRNCGQEHHPVVIVEEAGMRRVLPRDIDETPLDEPDSDEKPGYLMPEPENDPSFTFAGAPEDYPEEWTDTARNGTLRLRSDRRPYAAQEFTVDASGAVGTTGRRAWFLPGKFRLCPACGHQPAAQAREINKLAGLSAEGRSSATTLLVSSSLRWMNRNAAALPAVRRKLLGFTDNRQDAALQAGHFNDFFVRGAASRRHARRRARGGTEWLVRGRLRARPANGSGLQGRQSRAAAGMDARSRDQGRRPDRGRAHARTRPGSSRLGGSAPRLALHQPEPGRAGLDPARLSLARRPRSRRGRFRRCSAGASLGSSRDASRVAGNPAGSFAPGPRHHDRCARPRERRSHRQRLAPELARALVDFSAGKPARDRGADHRCPDAGRAAC